MRIRSATCADWGAIYPFFGQIMDAGETYAMPAGQSSEFGASWWMQRPPGRTVAAEIDTEDGPRVVGTAKMGPNRAGNGDHIGTASFLVDPAAAGRGVGRALAREVIAWHARQGYHGIQFNAVVTANGAAVHLWQSLGWQIVGTTPEAFRHPQAGLVGLHTMYRPIGPGDAKLKR